MSVTLKVMSLNIWGGKLLDEAIEFIETHGPDFILLQEVYSSNDDELEKRYHTLEVLIETLSEYSHQFAPTYSAGWLDGKAKAGNATFSKFPIVDNHVKFFDIDYIDNWQGADPPGDFSKAPRNMLHLVVNHPQLGKVDILNVHGIADKHGRDTDRRQSMTKAIVAEVSDASNVIIAGDFNMDSDTQAIKTITDTFTPVFPSLETSFNMNRKKDPTFAKLAVDKMFVSKSFQIVNANCPDVDISDHRPLIAELQSDSSV